MPSPHRNLFKKKHFSKGRNNSKNHFETTAVFSRPQSQTQTPPEGPRWVPAQAPTSQAGPPHLPCKQQVFEQVPTPAPCSGTFKNPNATGRCPETPQAEVSPVPAQDSEGKPVPPPAGPAARQALHCPTTHHSPCNHHLHRGEADTRQPPFSLPEHPPGTPARKSPAHRPPWRPAAQHTHRPPPFWPSALPVARRFREVASRVRSPAQSGWRRRRGGGAGQLPPRRGGEESGPESGLRARVGAEVTVAPQPGGRAAGPSRAASGGGRAPPLPRRGGVRAGIPRGTGGWAGARDPRLGRGATGTGAALALRSLCGCHWGP